MARVFAFLSMPIDMLTLSPFPTPPLARSLEFNWIRAQGTSALAVVLKQTKITTLKCAATPECSLSCQRPLTHAPAISLPPIPYSLGFNDIGAEGASALAAILKDTQITQLKCAAARVFAFVSMPVDMPALPCWQYC